MARCTNWCSVKEEKCHRQEIWGGVELIAAAPWISASSINSIFLLYLNQCCPQAVCSGWSSKCCQEQLWGWTLRVYPACQYWPIQYTQQQSKINCLKMFERITWKDRNVSPLTWAGIFPSFSSTRGSVSRRPTNTRLNCSTGPPLLFLRAGRTTHTLGRLPSPVRLNSSSLLLNVGVVLDLIEKREGGLCSAKQSWWRYYNTVVANTVMLLYTCWSPLLWPQTQHCRAAWSAVWRWSQQMSETGWECSVLWRTNQKHRCYEEPVRKYNIFLLTTVCNHWCSCMQLSMHALIEPYGYMHGHRNLTLTLAYLMARLSTQGTLLLLVSLKRARAVWPTRTLLKTNLFSSWT